MRPIKSKTCEDAEPPGVGRDLRYDADLHGKVRDGPEDRISFKSAQHRTADVFAVGQNGHACKLPFLDDDMLFDCD